MVDLEKLTGISYVEASNRSEIEQIVKRVVEKGDDA
jgi:hypothetical protein